MTQVFLDATFLKEKSSLKLLLTNFVDIYVEDNFCCKCCKNRAQKNSLQLLVLEKRTL